VWAFFLLVLVLFGIVVGFVSRDIEREAERGVAGRGGEKKDMRWDGFWGIAQGSVSSRILTWTFAADVHPGVTSITILWIWP
jgi:hypothetical protein